MKKVETIWALLWRAAEDEVRLAGLKLLTWRVRLERKRLQLVLCWLRLRLFVGGRARNGGARRAR